MGARRLTGGFRSLAIWTVLVVAMGPVGSLPGVARGEPQAAQAPLLPPIDLQLLAGRILFAFGDEGLLVPPSLISKDGSLEEATIQEKALAAGLSSVVSLLSPTGLVYGLGDVQGTIASKTGQLTLDGLMSIVPGSSFVLHEGLVTATGGSMSVHVDKSKFSSADLAGLSVLATISVDGGSLELKGDVDGTYVPGSLSLDGRLVLRSDFEMRTGVGESVSVRLTAGGALDVAVRSGALKQASFAGLSGQLDVALPSSNDPLRLAGSLSGEYRDRRLDLDASLTLRGPFTFQREHVTATLHSGRVQTSVTQGRWKAMLLQDVAVDMALLVGSQPLGLRGSIAHGSLDPAGGISFDADLDLVSPFVYERGPVKVTLGSGGVRVTVEDDRWTRAELHGVAAVAGLIVEDRPLVLHGSIPSALYRPETGFSFTAELELDAPFEYHRNAVTATLQSGSVTVTVHEGKRHPWVTVHQVPLPPLKVVLDEDDDEGDEGSK